MQTYSPLRLHSEIFRSMDSLLIDMAALLEEMRELRVSLGSLELDWYPKTIVDAERWPL